MAEITKGNGLLEYVDNQIFKFGEAGENDVIDYSFRFLKDVDEIEYIEKGCGCTSAYFSNGSIMGQLNLTKAGKYQPGATTVDKYVFVWINDGEPRFTADTSKQKMQNPAKKWFRLRILGTVVKEEEPEQVS